MQELKQRVAEHLAERGFEVYCTGSEEETKRQLLALIQPGQSVGIGGSMTIRELGVIDELVANGHVLYGHWGAKTPEEGEAIREQARGADVYLASANAVTADGRIVNIDGMGNRVASMMFGPKTVILPVGIQKLVEGGLEAAIARIRTVACPANAKRLKLPTPCGLTGKCNMRECSNDDAMCRVITILEHPTRGKRVVVLLSDEELGF